MARDAARGAATGPRPGARRIAACDLEAKTREARGIAMGVVRGSALLAEIPVSKTRKLFLLDKNAFSVVSTGNRYESGSNM